MSAFEKLNEMAKNPHKKTDDRPLVAVFPMWFPYELLVAAGLRASEWWGFETETSRADAHYPAFVCTVVKANFETVLADGADIDGMVFPSATCDSIQNSAGLFRRHFPDKFSAYFRMTQNPESKAAATFLRHEIGRVKTDLEAWIGREITEDDLRSAIQSVNRFRAAVRNILDKLAEGKVSVPVSRIYTAIKGAAADIGDESAALLEQYAEEIEVTEPDGPCLMLVGMVPDPVDVLDMMENAGAHIVGDDLGLGWRTFAVDASEAGDPIDALAQRLLDSPPCSSLHFASQRRADAVVERVHDLAADAVVFTRIKFCDPEAFDYPNVKKALDEAGIPNLLLEREVTTNADGAVATRVEAFLEQIS
ncbi:MAG: 2-hydroxyacyl-CoA dehydratase family protein [Candidatus Lernaella stagnicola]|nr:2-hydroxyacyl-CoA dehydratase family protein [Candidatus Lernaella stagnicola]